MVGGTRKRGNKEIRKGFPPTPAPSGGLDSRSVGTRAERKGQLALRKAGGVGSYTVGNWGKGSCSLGPAVLECSLGGARCGSCTWLHTLGAGGISEAVCLQAYQANGLQ